MSQADELRDEMLTVFRGIARYWAELPDVDRATGRPLAIADRCDGVVFSILAQLDGCGGLPAFDLTATVGEDEDGEGGERVTISEMLHERYSVLAGKQEGGE